MTNLINQIENNKNFNGGGLAVNITGKYESNRHAIAKIEKVTFGEAVKFLKTKKGGSLSLSATDLLSAYKIVNGEPEWHHAGFLPKSYGGGMKKTYFLDELPSKEVVLKWLKASSKKIVKNLRKKIEENLLEEKRNEFLKENAKQFSRLSSLPNFSVKTIWEMHGKYGWFSSDSKYKLDEYVSGWAFENEETLQKYNNIN